MSLPRTIEFNMALVKIETIKKYSDFVAHRLAHFVGNDPVLISSLTQQVIDKARQRITSMEEKEARIYLGQLCFFQARAHSRHEKISRAARDTGNATQAYGASEETMLNAFEPEESVSPELRALFRSAVPSQPMSAGEFATMASRVAQINATRPVDAEWQNHLTPRQAEIARLLSETGLSMKEIAGRLDLSDGTIRKHVENIYRRLGVHSRAELLTYLLKDSAAAHEEGVVRFDGHGKTGPKS
ncbi:MAG TPA: LuxR C-terminal-related transcriptional regulator [Polyangium sp.]|nr:LuxR C-terminal-related transcriptional regulator [Polyangium sp.]